MEGISFEQQNTKTNSKYKPSEKMILLFAKIKCGVQKKCNLLKY